MIYPQRTRTRDLFELNGIWDFARELDQGDYSNGFVPEKQVAVPSSYNDLFTEEEFRMHHAGVWYARKVTMPKMLKDERVVLRFNSVSYRGEAFLNGQRLGSHETGYTPFEFDVTDIIDFENENLITVRVENILSAETVPMGNLQNSPEPGQFAGQYPDTPFDFFPYAGIQRPVMIYTTSKTAWLDKVVVTTDVAGTTGTVNLTGEVAGSAAKAIFQCLETTVETPIADGGFSVSFDIENAKLWDVYQPNLYYVKIQILDATGNMLDEYTQRFGVRTVEVKGDRILLNGKPVYFQALAATKISTSAAKD